MKSKRMGLTGNHNRKWQVLGTGQKDERGNESLNESLGTQTHNSVYKNLNCFWLLTKNFVSLVEVKKSFFLLV